MPNMILLSWAKNSKLRLISATQVITFIGTLNQFMTLARWPLGKVIDVGIGTFGYPFIQKVLQN
jgi:hypothetical protein